MYLVSKKAFSFVELIVVVIILIMLGAVGIGMNNNYKEKTTNSKISSDLITIEGTISNYKQEKGKLPDPAGNIKYFSNEGNYAHNEVDGYGFNGFVTEETFPKSFLQLIPLDPRTKNYYAYGKTIKGNSFQLASVLTIDGNHESVVKGNYNGNNTTLYNLIREYNGPNFVYDKSTSSFPYNPDAIFIKGKISSFTGNEASGEIKINDTILSKEEILAKDLLAGDKIFVSSGSEVELYLSDGSIVHIGDPGYDSELTIAQLKNVDENNLYTDIKLALNFGTILVKASKLGVNSSFDVYTTDTEASVRGTVFEVSKQTPPDSTIVTVFAGSVYANRLLVANFNALKKGIEDNTLITNPISIPSGTSNDIAESITEDSITKTIINKGGEISINLDGNINIKESEGLNVYEENLEMFYEGVIDEESINKDVENIVDDILDLESNTFSNSSNSSNSSDSSNSSSSSDSGNSSSSSNNQVIIGQGLFINGNHYTGCSACPNGPNGENGIREENGNILSGISKKCWGTSYGDIKHQKFCIYVNHNGYAPACEIEIDDPNDVIIKKNCTWGTEEQWHGTYSNTPVATGVQ